MLVGRCGRVDEFGMRDLVLGDFVSYDFHISFEVDNEVMSSQQRKGEWWVNADNQVDSGKKATGLLFFDLSGCSVYIAYDYSPPWVYLSVGLFKRVNSEGNAGQAMGMEVFSTFQLAFTVFAVEDRRRRDMTEPGSLAIGFSLTAGALAAGHFSGGSMNPARSFGPALFTGIWEHHWVYWIGPMMGAFLAGASYEFFFASSASREKLVACLTCKDIEIVETASISRSSLSMATQTAARGRQTESKHEHN
ncbi:aquaporin-2-like [Pseudophryne corroboree]|uniref:aquaporin-2-like n=1 Tax=Pseudophryne corroboree TaxID=495146 RepID=UPI0030820376